MEGAFGRAMTSNGGQCGFCVRSELDAGRAYFRVILFDPACQCQLVTGVLVASPLRSAGAGASLAGSIAAVVVSAAVPILGNLSAFATELTSNVSSVPLVEGPVASGDAAGSAVSSWPMDSNVNTA